MSPSHQDGGDWLRCSQSKRERSLLSKHLLSHQILNLSFCKMGVKSSSRGSEPLADYLKMTK